MQQLVYIQNKVDNSQIRRTTNERGDDVIIVKAMTLPDDIVMNGLLYPAEEIAKGFASLENTLAPIGHPYNEKGEYISATDPHAIDYFYAGAVNKSVQRIKDSKYGNRVYLEKWINVAVAERTEQGKRLLKAIEKGEPLHSSTGVLVNIEPVVNNDQYYGIARDLVFDHDCFLLDEPGAATPEDGVGIMVNGALFKQVSRNGLQMQVNTVTIKNNTEKTLLDKFKSHMDAFFNSLATHGETEKPTVSDDADITTNQEGEDMSMKTLMKERLGDAYNEDMSEEDMLNAYDKKLKGNAADTKDESKGEQAKPEGELEVNAAVSELVKAEVAKLLKANADAAEKAERDSLTAEITANSKDFTVEDLAAVPVATLRKMAANSKQKRNSFGVAGGQVNNSNQSSLADMQMPE